MSLRHPIVRFVFLLTLLTIVFNAAFYLFIAESRPFESYLSWNARACAFFLRLFGEGATSSREYLSSSRFGLEIKHGCDAIQPIAFYVFAMLVSPVNVPIRKRLTPIFLGTAILLLLNLVRIITLFYSGCYFPNYFELLHIDVWQAAFIFLPLIMWIGWALAVARPPSEDPNAAP
ncbi:MAG: hypothetical protein HY287_13885 [Planctomycetes bacterium]|nr:hypothetical protein [Planctomycetota bacterium]MBI3835412.1 hypothetical protein [Planctomycetota bacterium]